MASWQADPMATKLSGKTLAHGSSVVTSSNASSHQSLAANTNGDHVLILTATQLQYRQKCHEGFDGWSDDTFCGIWGSSPFFKVLPWHSILLPFIAVASIQVWQTSINRRKQTWMTCRDTSTQFKYLHEKFMGLFIYCCSELFWKLPIFGTEVH